MQALKTDKNIKLKDDEECINFRPSPNFKHMKKYRKSKLDETNEHSSEDAPAEHSDELEKKPVNVMIQPPLPPNPPPPDAPITLKKEIIDEEYENGQTVDQSQTAMAEYKTEEPVEKSDKIMCRDFARGSCTRPACKHAHEIILSQLPGVFTFCKNFQNQGCTLPKCKFVHATVFEKEYYFRTGYLPPHTLAHLEENNTTQPPPRPPPQEVTVQPEIPIMYNNPPPPVVQPGPVATVPIVECPPVAETRTIPDVLSTALALTSPLKREWGKIEEFNGTPRDLDSNEPLVKKCKSCDVTEFRLQCSKNKVEKLLKASEEMQKKTAALNKKQHRLYTVLSLLKSSNMVKPNAPNILGSQSLNWRESDNEPTMMDQLSMILAANNRVASEEKNHLNSNMTSNSNFSTVLMKLLLSSNDQSVSSDPS